MTPPTLSRTVGGKASSTRAQVREIERTSGLPAAEQAVVAAIREGTQTPEAFSALARILLKQSKFDDALRAAAKAKALAPLESGPLILMGIANLRMQQTSNAAAAFAEAIRLDPSSARAHLGAAAVKLAEEDYEDALALCERVLEFDPTMERAHELIARINMKMGRNDKAIAELRSLIERNPENRRALRGYIRLLRREGRGDEALEFLERDAAANPGDKRRATRLAAVGAKSGRSEYATRQYEHLVEQGAVRPTDRVRYIMALIQAGEIDKAKAMIGNLGDQKVLKPVILKLDGDIALKIGDAAKAVEQYQAACSAARIDGLDQAQASAAEGPAELAKAWRAHTQSSLVSALRERRGAATPGK